MLHFPLSSENWEPSMCCLPTRSSFSKISSRLGCQRDNANSTGSMICFWLWEEGKCIHSDFSANFDVATDADDQLTDSNSTGNIWLLSLQLCISSRTLNVDIRYFFPPRAIYTKFEDQCRYSPLHFCCYRWSPEEIIQDLCPYIACCTSIL